jgi:hypothetical protein
MTISSQIRKAGPYIGNGSASAFPFAFKGFTTSDLYVVKTNTNLGADSVLTLGADYTVSLNADQNANPGGTITLTAGALASGYNVTITSSLQYLQPTDLTNQGGFYPSVITNALDRLTIFCQQLYDAVSRSLKVSVSTPAGVSTALPPPAANKLIAWNATADNLQNIDPVALATIVAFGTANADKFSGDGVTTHFALSANPGALNNLDVSVGGMSQRPGIDYTWSAGTTITFTTAPPTGTNNVLVRYMQGLPQGVTDSAASMFTQAGTGAVPRTGQDKMREHISVKDFGAAGNGSTDDTAAVQAAITYAQALGAEVFFPQGKYRTTSPIAITSGVTLRGVGAKAKNAGGADFLGGSWLYFDHTGRGVTAINSGGYFSDVLISGLGTYRNQPAPAASWAPNAHDYDLYCFGVSDIVLRDVLMLNPTKAVGFFGNPANGPGRLEIYNLRAQAFQVGIHIDTTYDVARLDHIHFWPFWRDDSRVHAYTMANLDAIYSLRNDNPMMSNIFTIFARAGLRVGQGANGGTSKIHLVNADFDRGKYGIWVDSTVTSGTTGQFDNITHQGETSFPGSMGVFIQSNLSTLAFGNFDSAYAWQNAVRVEGTGNTVAFTVAKAANYDQLAGNFPAFEALTGNTMVFATRPTSVNGGGIGGKFSGTGTVVCDEWRTFLPVVSSQTGSITAYTASGLYKLVGDTVTVEFEIIITTVGTAGGDIRFNLPFGTPLANFTGQGREAALTGKSLSVNALVSGTQAIIYNYDNTFCGATGARLVGTIQYRVSV